MPNTPSVNGLTPSLIANNPNSTKPFRLDRNQEVLCDKRAIVDIAKLQDYCLNPQHEDGKHKARVFAATLGIGRNDAEWLRDHRFELPRLSPHRSPLNPVRDPLGARLLVDGCVRFRNGEERLDRPSFRGLPAPHYLLCEEEWNIMKLIPLLAMVALTDDLPDHNLTRGQIGTVLEHLDRDGDHALLVEFSDEHGEAYAMEILRPEQLMALHRKTEAAKPWPSLSIP